ncbi:MAG: hypothetical protein HQ588_06450 [Deltaproteobacteria bacterium]|nr:hypothetical protein [Deltaproteobacteria bacterium]
MEKKRSSDSKNIPPSPNGLDEELKSVWEVWPEWRLAFLNRYSKLKKTLSLNFLKVNGVAISAVIIVTLLLHYIFPDFSITKESLSTLAIGILTASAAILTIIVAFLTFWFGSASNSMQKTRDMIRNELRSLDSIKRDIEPYTAGPKEGLNKALAEQVQKLAQESEIFLNSLKTITGRFFRAAQGTYYDGVGLTELDIAVNVTGGEWFSAYLSVFKEHSDHDFAKKTWTNAMDISHRITELNEEVRRASDQVMQIVYFMPTLISVLFIFIFSLVTTFMSSTNALQPLVGLIFGFILVTLLPTHLVITVRFLWGIVLSKHAAYETNRLLDIECSKNIEQRHPIDYTGALEKYAERITRASQKREETTSSENS